MTLNEYQAGAMRSAKRDADQGDMLVEAAMGLCGEAGEVIDLLKKIAFQGHDLNFDDLAEELGDVLWYIALGCTAMGRTMDELAASNLAKLRRRYPDGFDPERSTGREEDGR